MALWKCSLQLELYFLPQINSLHCHHTWLLFWWHWACCKVLFVELKGFNQELRVWTVCMQNSSHLVYCCWFIHLALYKISCTWFLQFLLYTHLPQMTIYSFLAMRWSLSSLLFSHWWTKWSLISFFLLKQKFIKKSSHFSLFQQLLIRDFSALTSIIITSHHNWAPNLYELKPRNVHYLSAYICL